MCTFSAQNVGFVKITAKMKDFSIHPFNSLFFKKKENYRKKKNRKNLFFSKKLSKK